MFEAHVLHLLRKYLGEYVEGLSTEALRISVWKGDVVLKDLKLKAEALNSLKLPVTVKAGFVGTITLKVPWKSLGNEPVIVLIDRVFILAHPAPDGQTLKEEDREKIFDAKLQQIEEAESAALEAASRRSKVGTEPAGNSWLGSLIGTIIGNLKVTISNVHVRYEDSVSNPGHPFCSGVTLLKLAAVTMDEQGNETFDTSGALDRLRKSLQLQRLAVYHDSDCAPWKLDKRWEDLNPAEWSEIFQDGIDEPASYGAVSLGRVTHKYLVSPINGVLKYHRLGKKERQDPDIPFEKASLVLSDVSLTISEAQYYDGIKLIETISRYKTRVDISHLRPVVPVSEDPHAWWRYAVLAGLQQKKLCYSFSWERIRHLCQLRRHYVQLYAASLQHASNVELSEIRQIEKILDSKVIILWRLLAHAKVESVKSKEASQRKGNLKRSWWSFGWRTTSEDPSVGNSSTDLQLVEEERLTKEEWQAIDKVLSYQADEESTHLLGKDFQNMIQFLIDVSIGQAAARIVNIHQTEVVCGRFEQLHVTTKLYNKTIGCDVSLKFYGLTSPEGSLAQSFISEKKTNALEASFVHAPVGEDVDWRLSAAIAPCHATILIESYNRLVELMKRSNAVSPTVAMETATALQMKIEQVTRRAQEQFQMVLEEQSSFALDIDFDAPKVKIPMMGTESTFKHSQFLLDFGHFTLQTREGQQNEQRQSLYSRFYISGRDMTAFFMDGISEVNCEVSASLDSQYVDPFYSLLDRCGMSVIVDQIKIPHPSYPSTRVSVQVPNLGIHLSPERYCRIMELLNIFYGSEEISDQNTNGHLQTDHVPWHPADLASVSRILVWKGIGHSLAQWHPCYLVLSGLYLYVLESESSQNYQRCCSMAGRQVFEVSPTSVGGSLSTVAVSSRGFDVQKALESTSTVIIEFRDEEEKAAWVKALVQATYRASAPPKIDILGESVNQLPESFGASLSNLGLADLVINGTLLETKVLIYGKLDRTHENIEEALILELLGSGGKVNIVQSGGGLTVKTKLHSLKIKDELQGRLSMSPQYLACSVFNDNNNAGGSSSIDVNENELHSFPLEEDDCFKDAMQDFMSTPDHSFHSDLISNLSANPDTHEQYIAYSDALNPDKDQAKVKNEIFYEATDENISDFVAVTFLTRNSESPLYDDIDTQLSICMSALEFFCNRPTLVALIDFGLDLTLASSRVSRINDTDIPLRDTTITGMKEENGRTLIKGLLGYGKGRAVFKLSMDVDSVCVFLNKEDGSQLAKFVQESFLLDLKVHPSSISVDSTIGNMRLRDMSLEPDNCWGLLCDTRNQGTESLIKFTFQSYCVEDDDYEGYDYSLSGRLSAVRIVFLYRFVQEITSYFMELASPHTEEAIKLVDKVGGIEWLIEKYEIEGAAAVKLDLSLDTPIIIIPKNSMSGDFMQLDLGQLRVKNHFSWHGCRESDPSAVHLDILHAEIHGVNMAIGINGLLGKPMVRDCQGFNIQVRRSLRDVFRKVPTLALEVQVGVLHGIMSDKEYDVILNCLYMNLYEPPRLPPSFRGNAADTKDSIRMLADKVNLSGQVLLSRSVLVVAVEVHHALLQLRIGLEESPLAQIALEGLWVSYRSSSLSEMDVYLTIPKFSILDIRPDTKPEMRLMLGSYTDISKTSISKNSDSTGVSLVSYADYVPAKNLEDTTDMEVSNLTMLIMDYRWRSSFQSFVIRIQQPRVLVVLDFLLAVVEFFVPALGTITGREETMNPKNDPLTNSNNLVLSDSVYKQKEDIVRLSPRRQLIVDGCGIDEFTYDGCGGTLSLSDEVDFKGHSYSGTIIIIGRGKKLRFKNVKIENGKLLRKCTYLSNESSYSISVDDGVEISLWDSCSSEMNKECLEPSNECTDGMTDTITGYDAVASPIQSFTFEAQVVSPEFTFYDCSKLSLDHSSHIEKLLRAKMDFSFMYAWKENDTWARCLVKDLTIETGSGLVVLEPLDIQGGYTSVRDKTNISLISTDICIHLSLSVASLILQLQNQAYAALQFGNADPLASCTNFKRIWVSSKGHFPGYNLTFWRPQAPPNYAILGDCVTSRPIPPSQVVVAVSNMYGRVRKPLGFKFVGSLSNFQELGDESQSKSDIDCSIWIPIAPPGYTALGCVTHVGNQPPPCHIVYCLRSDLVTSSAFSDCLFYVPSNPRSSSGFSIWRVDNSVGSFYAHTSVDCPPIVGCFDLHQILRRSPDWCLSVSNQSSSNNSFDNSQTEGYHSSVSSGWDILRSLSRSNYYMSTPHFERIWWEKGCDVRRPISVWRPLPRPGFAVLGDCITEGLEPPALGLVFKCDDSVISANPVQFTKVAHIIRKGLDEVFFWYPIPPPGYASLGCVVTKTDEAPSKDLFCCPRIDLVNQTNISEEPISRSSSSRGSNCWSIWKVENQAYTFLARSDLKKPSSRLAYSISDCVKPRTRENVTAEMKLGFFSLTILDNLFGMMTPLFDTTITNISLATHGRLEAMNAVLICSIAASTFNRRLEAWEPIIEPFDGIFKVETYDASEHPPSKIGKRVRIAATSTVNLNVSSANLETLTEAMVSWGRQVDLEKKSSNKSEEEDESFRHNDDLTYSALEEDDCQRVVVENKLGCDIYLRKTEEISPSIELLQHDNQTSLLMASPRFSDRLNIVSKSRETRYYVAVQIFESKGLPILDDGNSHDYFCALRLLSDSNSSDQRKLFPQSARTRCVKPLITKANDLDEGYAKWNELFIFEIPKKGLANLDVEVTNLASKAGKGEVIGALCLPIGSTATTLKRAASIRILQQAADVQHFSSYPLKRKVELPTNNGTKYSGSLVISTSYFERNVDSIFQRGVDNSTISDRDDSFWIGLGPDGPWECISSVLPLSVVPKSLNKNPFAFEIVMKNGKKHAILRSLAVVVNDTDIRLEVSICPASMLISPLSNKGPNSPAVVTEEIFENQRYQPISGWGSKSSDSHDNDSGRWSTRDFVYSSKDFFEPPLPPGWRWTSAWKIERSQLVDSDGWAYGTDFQSLKWPPTSTRSSSKSPLDFVRRRRWLRTRQQLPKENIDSMRNVVAIINPDSSAILPWTSMAKNMEFCLQIRPYTESSDKAYTWGQPVTLSSGKDQAISQQASRATQSFGKNTDTVNPLLKLNQLEKKDLLLRCNSMISIKQCFWLSVGADASVLHTELNNPIYDWKISINSALRLENKLPFQAEYAIWERTVEGNMAERQHGIISPAGCAFINSADLRKPIYLTLFVQGGWFLEKDSILIMDLLGLNHASSFWMVQQHSNRKLRVSVEHDMGGTDAAPKIVRLFVPYWISNDLTIPLSYRIVEVEPLENQETDSLSMSRAVKSAKFTLKNSSKSLDRKLSSRRNTQIFEMIEDVNPKVMLSPQYINRSVTSSTQSRNDTISSMRVGISVAVHHSEYYSPGISLLELERKERIDVKAFASDGSYYKLSAQLKMASNRTKVIHFLPQILFINRVGRSLSLSQYDTKLEEWLHPADPPKQLKWQSGASNEFIRLRLDGYKWSAPFSIQNEGVMCICMRSDKQNGQLYLRVEVRSGAKISRHEVLFHLLSMSSPYRIENRSLFVPIWFRQIDSSDDSWRCLPPNAAASFFWEDIGRQRLLEVLVDGNDPSRSEKYNIDEVMDHQPVQSSSKPIRALRLTVLKEGKTQIGRISDWMPDNESSAVTTEEVALPIFKESDHGQSSSHLESEFHVILELTEFGISIIDHMPEEIIYLSVQNLLLSYSSGLGSGISRFKLRMHSIQVDNQLPFSPMPVLFRPQRVGDELEYILKFSMTMQTNDSLDFWVYPYVGLQVPDNSAFLINIHEPIVWRLHEMFQRVQLNTVFHSPATAVSVDPTIKIGLLNISEIRFKFSMAMSPAQRPRGVLGFWSSLMTALGNTEHMPVRITQRFREELCMRQSALISNTISNIQKDLLSQPLQLLSGVDILGNASSALSNISKGVAALSMDKKFIQSRQKQDSKGVEDIGDVIREGGGAFAKGLFRGVTGILTKPLEGAKSSGVEGFVQGVGKGLIGAAAQPVSGVLDLLSKTTEGANAVRMKIASAITSEEQLLRRRLPRVIGGDNLLQPYDEHKATGQAILQLAESGAFFSQGDLFKVRGKFAFSDAYEDHFQLPKGKILVVTHRRSLLLHQPSNIMGQRKFNPARDPCSVLWDVLWDDLVTMELTVGKKDSQGSPPSRLVLYLQSRSIESKENVRIIKCIRGSNQAREIYSSIELAQKTYGPHASKDIHKRKVPRPITPCTNAEYPEVFGVWGIQGQGQDSMNSAFGSLSPSNQDF